MVGMMLACVAAICALALPAEGSSATGSKPPTVTTGGLPQVSASAATLKGAINAHGSETTYAFQYGTAITYGDQTPPTPIGAGSTEAKVSQTISGLQPNTVYHFRLVAANAAGTTNGGDVIFTTKKIPLAFQIASSPEPVVFGSRLTVSGVLSGTGASSHAVVLQATPFPYKNAFSNVGAPVLTDTTGHFSFSPADLMANTELRVITADAAATKSPVIVAHVAVRVSLHVRSTGRQGLVRLYGTVAPAEPGARVGLQLMRPGREPLTVAGAIVKSSHTGDGSRFNRIVHIHRGGLYRAWVRVIGDRRVSGHSQPLLIH